MPEISLSFVDTSAWCAFLNASDRNHHSASAAIESRASETLVTTTHVAEELSRLTHLYDNQAVAIQFGLHVWRGDFAYVIDPNSEIVQHAWQIFKTWRSRGASYVDCVTAAVVGEYEIDDVIAYGPGLRILMATGQTRRFRQTGSYGQ